MKKARSTITFFASALAVALLAANCTVKTSDGSGDDSGSSKICTPGTTLACTCTDGRSGSQTCRATGTAYDACICDSTATGGSGGTTSVTGGSGGSVSTGGTLSEGGDGGAGGADVCNEPDADPCFQCLKQRCCTQFKACLDSDQCGMEFPHIQDCIVGKTTTGTRHTATVSDVNQCVLDAGAGNWPGTCAPETQAIVDCMGGDPTAMGAWRNGTGWNLDACSADCFSPP